MGMPKKPSGKITAAYGRLDMIDDLDASSSTLRMLVSEALRKWTEDTLMGLLEEEDVIVRTAAARELQARGGVEIFKRMQTFAVDKRPYVREIAAFILGQLGTPLMPLRKESLPILLQLASDQNADVRSATAAAFGHLCYEGMPKDVEDCLIKFCLDEDKDVRACAAYALGNSSGSLKIRALLTKLLEQDYVGSYAELGLEILDDKQVSQKD
jgi:HEAT repeat protein